MLLWVLLFGLLLAVPTATGLCAQAAEEDAELIERRLPGEATARPLGEAARIEDTPASRSFPAAGFRRPYAPTQDRSPYRDGRQGFPVPLLC
ncbi:MAG: hypothetical protein D6731_04810 [Planctomycetota bacterium]|nr:MAG: hypothetical protein D6731_04810 [Planctomycetota bacterium]